MGTKRLLSAARVLALCLALVLLDAGSAPATPPETPVERDFGAGLTLDETTPLDRVVSNPERFVSRPILVRGHLTDLCMKKGCWTVLTDGDAVVRVRFADYGFFLPKDALGSAALVEGRAEIRELSEREARHYAAESRNGDPGAIEGSQREIGLVATGVRLLPTRPDSP